MEGASPERLSLPDCATTFRTIMLRLLLDLWANRARWAGEMMEPVAGRIGPELMSRCRPLRQAPSGIQLWSPTAATTQRKRARNVHKTLRILEGRSVVAAKPNQCPRK